MPTTLGKAKRRGKATPKKDDFIVEDELSLPELSEEDDDVQIVDPPRKRRRRAGTESDDSDDEPVTPARRTLKRPRNLSKQEQDDLDEDLDFLEPSSDVENSARKPRSTQSIQSSARQQALEKLKRTRMNKTQLDPVSENNEDGSDSGSEGSEAWIEDDDDLAEAHTNHAPSSSKAMFEADEYDEGFLEDENEDNTLGVPSGIPLAFTRFASMKAKELFKFAIEWMVQKKINPAFNMNDEIYDLTFKKLDDEVRGLAGSKFTSAAWTPEFTRAVQARPEVAFETLDRSMGSEHEMRDRCDACNRGSHPATFQMQFQGKPYNPNTLEDVGINDDEEDDSSSTSDSDDSDDRSKADKGDEVDYDSQGREVPPQSKIYYVGKFCQANAATAHALQHWKYHLNEFVLTWLISKGFENEREVIRRDRMSTRKRRKLANKIVDRMVDEGKVKELWGEFKGSVESARNSKQGRFERYSP